MKKWIFSLTLVFSFSLKNQSIQKMVHHDHDVIPQKFMPHENDYLSPDAVQTERLRVVGMKIEGFSGSGLKKLQDAFSVLEIVANSQEFKDRVINFKNSKGERQFASNNGLTNEEVYEHFMEGRETLQTNTPGEMNFYLKLYYARWSKVIGYTSGQTNQININDKFFRNFRPSEVASNLAHEWTHKLGFDHRSAKEHDSVPYAIGYIVGDMAAKLLKGPVLH